MLVTGKRNRKKVWELEIIAPHVTLYNKAHEELLFEIFQYWMIKDEKPISYDRLRRALGIRLNLQGFGLQTDTNHERRNPRNWTSS